MSYLATGTVFTLYSHELTLIPAWIRNYMPGKVWDKITYPLPNFNDAIGYLSMLRLKLIHVSKGDFWIPKQQQNTVAHGKHINV